MKFARKVEDAKIADCQVVLFIEELKEEITADMAKVRELSRKAVGGRR